MTTGTELEKISSGIVQTLPLHFFLGSSVELRQSEQAGNNFQDIIHKSELNSHVSNRLYNPPVKKKAF